MRHSLIGLLLLALLGIACGGSSAAVPDPAPAEPAASADAVAASPDTAAASAADESVATTTAGDGANSAAEAPQIDGPPAPDFTLALADGSEFTLSAAAKPVYMVFWAEW